MKLVVAIDHRFRRTPDGVVWSMTSFTHYFWQRYLSVFDEVRVLARVQDVADTQPSWQRSSGDGVTFVPVPYYHGPWQYLQTMRPVRRAIRDALRPQDAVLLRVQGQVASVARPFLRQSGHPYAVEVVGDPYDAFAKGYVTHPLRPFLQWWLPRRMREQCAGACAAAYVTAAALQQRYPPAPDAFSTYYSSIVLTDDCFAPLPRPFNSAANGRTLVFVGTLDNLSKGVDTLIAALGRCAAAGLNLNALIVGGGKYRASLVEMAAQAGVGDRVHFCGWQPAGAGVRNQLDRGDLFVLPSRQEGLSRATLEAMARALPCIATTVGGTGEILPAEDLVAPNDPVALAQKIREVVSDPARMARMSARNLATARAYHEQELSRRWTALYRHLREVTAAWQNGRFRSAAPVPSGGAG